jgi:hypothetical protein
MPAQSEKVIISFLTRFAYEKLAVSAAWRIPPGFKVMMLGPFLDCLSCHTLRYSGPRMGVADACLASMK